MEKSGSTSDVSAVFQFLIDYPVPAPRCTSDDPVLRFEHYPGQDFVVGLCNECISITMEGFANPDLPRANRELMCMHLDLLKWVRARRLRLLAAAKEAPKKYVKLSGDKIKDLQWWLENNEGHPNWDAKLKEYESAVDAERFVSDVEEALF